jgi:hypothetical protein
VHSVAVVGSDPILMLTGPIPATAKVLARAGLGIADIGAFEVNEAFAPVVLAWLAETGADPELVNPRGGAIASDTRWADPRTPGHDPAAPHAAERDPIRPADDVRGWRHGERDGVRAALTKACVRLRRCSLNAHRLTLGVIERTPQATGTKRRTTTSPRTRRQESITLGPSGVAAP